MVNFHCPPLLPSEKCNLLTPKLNCVNTKIMEISEVSRLTMFVHCLCLFACCELNIMEEVNRIAHSSFASLLQF